MGILGKDRWIGRELDLFRSIENLESLWFVFCRGGFRDVFVGYEFGFNFG